MTADLLRRAAAKLREHASAASASPWVAEADGLVWPPRIGDPVSGSTEVEDAEYIARMHPPVALALAELLDHLADDVSDAGDRTEPGGLVRNEYGSIRFDWTAAAKLARAVLREDPS